ncbi:MAG: A/G-specific adenine glycosylase [Clostridia bacterium]|nr:A/G-specific adenine glycosylase [Clostridia bacterium]
MLEEETRIPTGIVPRLLKWYDQGHRILPWRTTPIPYYVWVSEIMLQQTRVEAVIPYFKRFVTELPDVFALAGAEESVLMKLWEGLGYYRRVRNLQAAAKRIVAEYDGEMPASYAMLRELPGIGEYTAGAIASIAFGLPTPAVDGNVLRVLSRVCEDYRDILKQSVKKDIGTQLAAMYPRGRCGDFTQSLMELGATVCIPNGTPHCDQCPLSDLCLAYQHNSTDELPVKTPKKPRKVQRKTVFLLYDGDKIALQKRAEDGLLAGMWEYPNLDLHLSQQESIQALADMGIVVTDLEPWGKAEHIFTHIEWKMQVYRGVCQSSGENKFVWVTEKQMEEEFALPTAFRKIKRKNP